MAKRSHALHILCIWNLLCVCGWVCSHAFASDLASSSLPSLSGIWYPTLYFVPFQVGHSLTALETFAEHCLASTLSNLLFRADLQNAWTVLTLNDLRGFISRFLSLSGKLSFLAPFCHLTSPCHTLSLHLSQFLLLLWFALFFLLTLHLCRFYFYHHICLGFPILTKLQKPSWSS